MDDIWRISYAVVPINPRYDKRFYQDLSFAYRLFPTKDFLGNNRLMEMKYWSESRENIIEIETDSLHNIFVNGNPTTYSNLKTELIKFVMTNTDYIFKVYVNESNSFAEYFQVISNCRESIQELRNEYSLKHFSHEFENLSGEERDSVRHIFPERIFELNKVTKSLLNIQ